MYNFSTQLMGKRICFFSNLQKKKKNKRKKANENSSSVF